MKKAVIFKAKLPLSRNLEGLLGDFSFKPVMENSIASHGFEFADKASEKFIGFFEGGYFINYRIDKKIIPNSVVKERLSEDAESLEKKLGRPLKRYEKITLKDKILSELVPVALVKTQRVKLYYSEKSETLFVETSSEKVAQTCVSQLVKAMGSLKTSTIHIDNIKVGLAKKIQDELSDEDPSALGKFLLNGDLVLEKEKQGKITYKLEEVTEFSSNIVDQVASGYKVNQVSLNYWGSLTFKINSNFIVSQIKLVEEVVSDEFDSVSKEELESHELSLRVALMDGAVQELCNLLEYKDQ